MSIEELVDQYDTDKNISKYTPTYEALIEDYYVRKEAFPKKIKI